MESADIIEKLVKPVTKIAYTRDKRNILKNFFMFSPMKSKVWADYREIGRMGCKNRTLQDRSPSNLPGTKRNRCTRSYHAQTRPDREPFSKKPRRTGKKYQFFWSFVFSYENEGLGWLANAAVATTDTRSDESVPKCGINGQSVHRKFGLTTVSTFCEPFHVVGEVGLANLASSVFDGEHSDHWGGVGGNHVIFSFEKDGLCERIRHFVNEKVTSPGVTSLFGLVEKLNLPSTEKMAPFELQNLELIVTLVCHPDQLTNLERFSVFVAPKHILSPSFCIWT
jgi:hypothetical protein